MGVGVGVGVELDRRAALPLLPALFGGGEETVSMWIHSSSRSSGSHIDVVGDERDNGWLGANDAEEVEEKPPGGGNNDEREGAVAECGSCCTVLSGGSSRESGCPGEAGIGLADMNVEDDAGGESGIGSDDVKGS